MNIDICPISGDPVASLPTTGDYIEFDCPTCGRFRISCLALEAMTKLPRQDKEAFLNKARSNAQGGDGIPFIRDV
jgi:hypothetical protein